MMIDDELDNDDCDYSMNEIISDSEEELSIIDQNDILESDQDIESSKSSNQEAENELGDSSDQEDEMGKESDEDSKYLEEH
jgi:hypothetical protein